MSSSEKNIEFSFPFSWILFFDYGNFRTEPIKYSFEVYNLLYNPNIVLWVWRMSDAELYVTKAVVGDVNSIPSWLDQRYPSNPLTLIWTLSYIF